MIPKRILFVIFTLTVIVALSISCKYNDDQNSADVIIYGGTSAGISAAIQTVRLGKSVILIEPTNRLGGLTTGGLGQTDIGNKQVIGGIAREFYRNIKKYYDDSTNWVWQTRSEYKDGGQTRTGMPQRITHSIWIYSYGTCVYDSWSECCYYCLLGN